LLESNISVEVVVLFTPKPEIKEVSLIAGSADPGIPAQTEMIKRPEN
jgi:hypothetical protein